jgi:dihydroorotate dehydrogenase
MWGLGAVEHSRILRGQVAPTLPNSAPVDAMGLTFAHPLGLAGGFDKNAERVRALEAIGFSFLEVGTVTALPQLENPAPNLFRLPKDRALINRLGFPNQGAEIVSARVLALRAIPGAVTVPLGMSIGKSRAIPPEDLDAVCADYEKAFVTVAPASDFVVVNVSSPNTQGLRSLQAAEFAERIFSVIMQSSLQKRRQLPLLVKVSPDLEPEQLDSIVDVAKRSGLAGIIASNTTIQRHGLETPEAEVTAMGAGGLSGPPLFERNLAAIKRIRARVGSEMTVIAVGGIEGPKQLRAYLDAGANLAQAYTGFIYAGPSFVAQCLQG